MQEQEFERLGGTKTIPVNVRVVAATNRDLTEMIAEGRFRRDLYYRLNVFPIALPPLRERADDIPHLVRHFTQGFARRIGRRIVNIPPPVMDALVRYPWPGNVRELQNVIERAVLVCDGDVVHGHHLPPTLQPAEASGTMVRVSLDGRRSRLDAARTSSSTRSEDGTRGNCCAQKLCGS